MKDTRIEILRNGIWRSLELASDKAIRYNAVVNQIGKVASREISHSNTFSLPYIHANVDALGINVFNAAGLARSMNMKHFAKYYIENKIVRTGYLVINNTNGGTINCNFIDEGLSLLDKWGSTTYKELLESTEIEFAEDVQDAIDELIDYDMDVTSVLTSLSSQIGTRGYPLALFPNNLNAIGDDFQKDENGVRHNDAFDPYQSRPVWNVQAFFDIACEAYGYTPVYHDSVNWDNVQLSYMVEKAGNEKGEEGTQTVQYLTVNGPQDPYYTDYGQYSAYQYHTLALYDGAHALKPNEIDNWTEPSWLYYYNYLFPNQTATPWMNQECVFTPNTLGGNVGDITHYARNGVGGVDIAFYAVGWKHPIANTDIVWQNYNLMSNPPTEVTYQTADAATFREHTVVVDKALFNTPPFVGTGSDIYVSTWPVLSFWTYNAGADRIEKTSTNFGTARTTVSGAGTIATTWELKFVVSTYTSGDLYVQAGNSAAVQVPLLGLSGEGVTITVTQSTVQSYFVFSGDFVGEIDSIEIREAEQCTALIGTMLSIGKGLAQVNEGELTTMRTIEEFLPQDAITFNEQGEYNPQTVDLRFAAPRKSIKDLISGYMHKDGILIDVNAQDKEVTFFNYGIYEENRDAGNYSDWSDYLLKYAPFKYDTDFGNDFAKKNRIGLSSPYPGNTYDFELTNQGEESKFKDYAEDNNRVFKDITNVVSVANTNNPYFEYTNQGLGLVEHVGDITGTLTQRRADGTTQGTFNFLPKLANVNGLVLPNGVEYWYNLVDSAVKVEAQFLIPVEAMRTLNMEEPIFVNELGGFWIIEKIEEYVDSRTPCTVKLIKLIDDLQREDAGGEIVIPTPELIILTGFESEPSIFSLVYGITSLASFLNYTPTAAYVEYRKLDGDPAAGGTYTGTVITHNYTFPPYTSVSHTLTASNPITPSEEGWYEIQVVDTVNSLSSNIINLYLGDNSIAEPEVTATVHTSPSLGLASGEFKITWQYIDHEPTSSVLSFYKADFLTGTATGSTQTFTMPLTPETGLTSVITPSDGPGYYVMTLTTNEATWQPGFYGTNGVFIT